MARLAGMAWPLCSLVALGCVHPGIAPVATTPRAGDHISALPPSAADAMQVSADGCDRGSLSTWCDPDAEEHASFVPLEVEPWRGIEDVAMLAWADASGSKLVVADAAHGLRVVDATDPSHPRVLGPLPLPAAPQRVLIAGSRALVVVPHGPDAHELLAIELGEPTGPRLLARSIAAGELRGAYRWSHGASADRVLLVVDTVDEAQSCGPRLGTVLREIELGDRRIATHQELALGPDVIGVGRRGDFLFVLDMVRSTERAHEQVRAVDLAAPQGGLTVSSGVPAGDELLELHADGRRVRMVWKQHGEQEDGTEVATHHLSTLRLSHGHTLEVESQCSQSAAGLGGRHGFWPMSRSDSGVLFLGERTLIFHGINPRSAWVFTSGSCTPETHVLPRGDYFAAPDGSQLIGIDRATRLDERGLHVRLYDPSRLPEPVARADVAAVEQAATDASHERGYRPERATLHRLLRGASGSHGDGAFVLSVPFEALDSAGTLHEGAQVLYAARGSISAGPRLDAQPWRVLESGRAVLRDPSGLRLTQLHAAAAPAQLGAVELWPRHARAVLVDGGVARLRWPSPSRRYEPIARAAEGRLELVPDDRDPQAGQALASFALSSRASLTAVGPLVVASLQVVPPEADAGREQPCRFEVFDVRDLRSARRTAVIGGERLCTPLHPLEAHQRLALPHALVFARAERIHDRGEITISRFALFVLDLRDAEHPRWHGPFRTPLGEWTQRLFVDGARVAYAYRVPRTPRGALRPEVYHYLREIDFTDPGAPSFGEPTSVAGEPLALDGDEIFTRDALWREGPCTAAGPQSGPVVEHAVRRLRRRGQRAELLASYAVGAHEPASIAAAKGPDLLLVALHLAPSPDAPAWAPRTTRIVALDRRRLTPSSETTLKLPAVLVAEGPDMALFRTVAGELHVIDLRDAAGVRVDAVLPHTSVLDARDYEALLSHAGVLRRASTLPLAMP